MVKVKSFQLAKPVDEGMPKPGEDLVVKEIEVSDDVPQGGIKIKNIYLSMDPYMRGLMRSAMPADYVAQVYKPNTSISGGVLGEVIESKNENFKEGQKVFLNGEFQELQVVENPSEAQVMPLPEIPGVPLTTFGGALGMPGFTAYAGLYKYATPKKGNTLFVSGGAGAVGHIVGQLAKLEGMTVIGSAGSDEKVKIMKELGFDHAFNYKTASTAEKLQEYAPKGIDIYFDNVGGETLDTVLLQMNKNGEVIACGAISGYNEKQGTGGVKNWFMIIVKRITVRGFIVLDDFGTDLHSKFQKEVGQYLTEGKIKAKETVFESIDKAPEHFVAMMKGANVGKTMVKV